MGQVSPPDPGCVCVSHGIRYHAAVAGGQCTCCTCDFCQALCVHAGCLQLTWAALPTTAFCYCAPALPFSPGLSFARHSCSWQIQSPLLFRKALHLLSCPADFSDPRFPLLLPQLFSQEATNRNKSIQKGTREKGISEFAALVPPLATFGAVTEIKG